MIQPNLLIFYVEDPLESSKFYQKLFERTPQFSVPTYVCFQFENGFYFALWSTKAKDFVSMGSGQRMELSFMVKEEREVLELYNKWKNLGVTIEQEFHQAVFGPTFVALDPDQHRIRVCIPD